MAAPLAMPPGASRGAAGVPGSAGFGLLANRIPNHPLYNEPSSCTREEGSLCPVGKPLRGEPSFCIREEGVRCVQWANLFVANPPPASGRRGFVVSSGQAPLWRTLLLRPGVLSPVGLVPLWRTLL